MRAGPHATLTDQACGSLGVGAGREQPTKNGIGEDNIGSRLMQQMGWQRGTGLGRNQSGMVNPIQVRL